MTDPGTLTPRHLRHSPATTSPGRTGLAPALAPAQGRGTRTDRPWLAALDGTRLRRVRREHGLSQERLAHKAGLSITTVARLERQPRTFCVSRTLTLLSEALGEAPDAITPAVQAGDRPAARDTAEVRSSWTCTRTFPARPDQVRQAREFLRRLLAGCPAAGDAVLICSELAANAVVHSASGLPGGWFTVRAEVRDGDFTWIEVEDQGGRWAAGDITDDRKHGLEIVAAMADYWDIRGDDTGRRVCARLDWPVPDVRGSGRSDVTSSVDAGNLA